MMVATTRLTPTLLAMLVAGFLGGCAASSVDQVVDAGPSSATATARSTSQRAAGADRAAISPDGSADVAERTAMPSERTAPAAKPRVATGAIAGAPAQGVGAITVADKLDNSVYRIGPLDVIDVNVFMVPELTKSVQVSENGTVNFPLIGETRVVGRTSREVEQTLTQQLGSKYLQNPQVSVSVKEFNSQRVTVEGSVKKPGVYALRDRMSLVQVIAIGGGLDELSDEQVLISRDGGGKRLTSTYDLAQIRTGATPDPEIKAGDVVFVGKSSFKEALNNLSKVTPIAGVLRPF